MKQFVIFLLAITATIFSYGQKPKSTVRFSLSDGSPLVITINERDYQKVGTNLIVSDLPRKRHSVRIYKFRPYADGKGGKAELAYVGNIKIEPGNKYDAILNMQSGKLHINQVRQYQELPASASISRNPNATFNPNQDQAISTINASEGLSNNGEFELPKNVEENLSQDLISLKANMLKEVKDGDKLRLANAFVDHRKVSSTEALAIMKWINFDDNKLAFAKHVKQKLTDPSNANIIAEGLSFSSSKEEYLNAN